MPLAYVLLGTELDTAATPSHQIKCTPLPSIGAGEEGEMLSQTLGGLAFMMPDCLAHRFLEKLKKRVIISTLDSFNASNQ